jgi:hypothetical protein
MMLHVIKFNGVFDSAEYEGRLEYKCPPFKVIRDLIAGEPAPELTVEHVSVLWQGKHCHMFVDEDGRAKGLPRNDKASRIYYNYTWEREHKTRFIYDNLHKPGLVIGDESPGFDIVGTAVLWEGDME